MHNLYQYSFMLFLIFEAVKSDLQTEEQLPVFGEPIQNISTIAGRDVTFYCKIHSIGRYKAEWSKIDENGHHWSIGSLGSRVSLMYVDETTWPLRIRNVQNEDRGTYMCKVNTEPVTMQVAYLHVAIPPRIIDGETSGNARIEEGSPITLVCKGSGSPHPSIGWRREGNAEITYFSKYHGLRKVRYYVGDMLQLHQVSREDAGIYYCLAVNGVPPIPSKRIILEVFFRPEMRVVHYKIEANVGDDVDLICKVESYPKPENSWLKSGVKVPAKSPKYETSEEIIQVKGSYFITMKLKIIGFTKEDAANYVCTSTNSLGYSESTIKVYGSEFEYFEDEEELEEMGGKETNCILDLKRNTYINPCCRRTKIGIPYHGKIIYLHQKREKVFEPSPCSSIINSFRPEMKVPHYKIDSSIGEDATIICKVEAYPKPMNVWLQAGKTRLSKNSKYDVIEVARRINFSYVIKMRLTIKNFTANDSTIYTCASRNMLGYSESSIKINARKGAESTEEGKASGKPSKKDPGCLLDYNMNNYLSPCCRRNPYPGGSDVMVPSHIIKTPIGSNISIPCTVLHNPTNKNKWTKFPGNQIIVPNKKFNVTHENVVQSRFHHKMDMILTIANLTEDDAGRYACSTKSSLEYKEVIFQVDVTKETSVSQIFGTNNTSVYPIVEALLDPNLDFTYKRSFVPDFERGKPQIQTPCYKVEHKFGEDIVLTCVVKAFPRPISSWKKHPPVWFLTSEEEILKSSKKYEVNEQHTGYFKITMQLTIRSFGKYDETSYTCASRNSYGAAEATIKVFGVPQLGTKRKMGEISRPEVNLPESEKHNEELPDKERPEGKLPEDKNTEDKFLEEDGTIEGVETSVELPTYSDNLFNITEISNVDGISTTLEYSWIEKVPDNVTEAPYIEVETPGSAEDDTPISFSESSHTEVNTHGPTELATPDPSEGAVDIEDLLFSHEVTEETDLINENGIIINKNGVIIDNVIINTTELSNETSSINFNSIYNVTEVEIIEENHSDSQTNFLDKENIPGVQENCTIYP